ncbi:MAG: 3-dehydroquinate synthase [bacterium]|nr:3-dehydroquinate synthase [bacterium]
MKQLSCQPAGEPESVVTIGSGLLGAFLGDAKAREVFAVLDPFMAEHPTLRAHGDLTQHWHEHIAEPGEAQKTLAACETVLRAMVAAGLDRESLCVAIGGGAVGDAGGLCASLYMRGIELWQVPTTLLAMVDSSVGGKTAVNLPEGKNLVGSVHPASRILIDVDFLTTLPENEFRSGLAEAVKMAIGVDRELFELLDRQSDAVLDRQPDVLLAVIERAIAGKIAIVEGDLHEGGQRRLLNLGHTLGHAIEGLGRGTLAHGLCVARGLHFALELARDLGALATADFERSVGLLTRYGYERDPLPPTDELMAFVQHDKKVQGDTVQFALPTGIGTARVEPIRLDRIRQQLAR